MNRLKTYCGKLKAQIGIDYLVFYTIGSVLALILRIKLFDYRGTDFSLYFGPWYDYILSHGGLWALKDNFSNYTPPYSYILLLATLLPLPNLYAIKLLSVICDFFLAGMVAATINIKYSNKFIRLVSFLVVLFTPTVFFNSALWAQNDVFYTTFLIASIYFSLKNKFDLSLLFLGISFSIKLQAVFIFPLFFILYLKRKIPLKEVIVVPIVYLIIVSPVWLLGRSIADLLTIYLHQANTYDQLTLNAPNIYQWLPDGQQDIKQASTFFAISIVSLFCLIVYKSEKELSNQLIIKIALVSSILLPYLLPHMHERYFFPADVLSIIYAFFQPKFLFVPILVIFASFFSYFPFLFNREPISLSLLAGMMGFVLIVTTVDLIVNLYPKLATDIVD